MLRGTLQIVPRVAAFITVTDQVIIHYVILGVMTSFIVSFYLLTKA